MRRGDEPATARSALRLRRVLSILSLVGFGVASVLFFVAALRDPAAAAPVRVSRR